MEKKTFFPCNKPLESNKKKYTGGKRRRTEREGGEKTCREEILIDNRYCSIHFKVQGKV